MRSFTRTAVEMLLLMLLASGMLVAAVVVAQHIFDDEKTQYFAIGYYVAIHSDVVRWIWKKLRAENPT